MSRSDTYTILPLDEYARIMGIDTCGFNQCKLPTTPTNAECPDIWFQLPNLRTSEAVGRDDVALAMNLAEDMIAHALGFKVGRTWETHEDHPWPYPHNQVQLEYPTIQTAWGYVVDGGIKASAMVSHSAAVTYSDTNSDSILDTATITVTAADMAIAGASVRELGVFFEFETDDVWEIRPLKIVENPTTHNITITGPACRFLDPDLWNTNIVYDLDYVPPAVPSGNFVTRVDVRRIYNDTTHQGEIVWRGGDYCSQYTCQEACQNACMTVDHPRLGLVRLTPATYDAVKSAWVEECLNSGYPSAVRLNYYAGLAKQYDNASRGDGKMSNLLAEAIVRLANTLLPVAPCGCGLTNQRWVEDRKQKETIDSVDAALANSAFGSYMAGAIFAWSVVKRFNPLGRSGSVRS